MHACECVYFEVFNACIRNITCTECTGIILHVINV